MAEDKKSFVAYCDWGEIFDKLSDEEAGKLAKHLFNYVNDRNPESDDRLVEIIFIPIKQALKRDLRKYEHYIDKQKSNGSKGGRPKTQKTQPFFEEPKKADNVNVSVNVNDNVTDIKRESNETTPTPKDLPTKTGEDNPDAKKDEKSLHKPATKPFQSAEHWRKRLTEEHKLSFRRMLLAKFRNTPDDQLNYAMFLYLDWWNLKHPEGETFKTFTSWFSYYVSDMKDLPKTPDKIKML